MSGKDALTAVVSLTTLVVLSADCRMSAAGPEERVETAIRCEADFFVSLNGNDAWSGKRTDPCSDGVDGPFRTLERARDEVRLKLAAGEARSRGAVVAVRAGFYPREKTFMLGREDSGSETAPVIYMASPGETVVLAGGRAVPADAFVRVSDAAVLDRLDAVARLHVLQADLRAIGIVDPGSFPDRYQGAPTVPELFFNGQRMTLARWPDEGWATIARIVDGGSDYRGTRGGVFEYSGDRPARWNLEEDVWLHGYWRFDWHDEVIRVQSIDHETRRIALAAQSVYGVGHGNPSPRRYCALNLLEELDRPGEYYIDRRAGRLYFWPPAPLEGALVVLSTLKGPLVSIENASEVTLRGFTVEATQGNGIEARGGRRVRIQACTVRNTRRQAVVVSGGTGHRVENCDIYDTGTGGITLSGGDRPTLKPAGHEAVGNHIRRFARHKLTYSNALSLEGVGNRAAHNLVHDSPHQAVAIVGNDHLFEYNLVHDVCLETDDCGALYKGRNPSARGNIIRFNFWRDIGRPMGHGNAAVYFDDGDGGETVFGNIFLRCGNPGQGSFGAVFSHGGHDNLAENNIFIDCPRALGSSPWNDARWRSKVLGSGDEGWDWDNKLLREVDITRPPYTTRYPELAGFMDPRPGQVRVNRATRNVFVRCDETAGGNWQFPPGENWTVDRAPGFVDAAAGDYRLKRDSEVFTKLPGFQAIPFEKIGLPGSSRCCGEPLRAEPPVPIGAGAAPGKQRPR